MVKAKTAIVIVILVLVQFSWTTIGDRFGDISDRFGNIVAVQDGNNHFGPMGHNYRYGGSQHGVMTAVMTVNRFRKAEDGGSPAACDGRFHSADDLVVALSPGCYAGGKRCHKTIRITSVDTGRTVKARVVDKFLCTYNCKNNIVHSSPAVWKKLGLNTDVGKVHVTWYDA